MKKLGLFLLLFHCYQSNAQIPSLLKDCNIMGDGDGSYFMPLKDKTVFVANDGINGYELWITDGTEPGTHMVVDIVPSPSGWAPREFKVIDDILYFSADDGNGFELYRSDGTSANTFRIKDINTKIKTGSDPRDFIKYKDKVYFSANDGDHGFELWVTDGTDAGTKMLKDVYPGPAHGGPNGFTVFKDKLYFFADDGTSGIELWVSDGTDTGTVLFKDIQPGTGSSQPFSFFVYKDIMLFTAITVLGRELWSTDGTEAGTTLLKDINFGAKGSNPQYFTIFKDRVYFSADNSISGVEMWSTDGTTAGTKLFSDINTTSTKDGIGIPAAVYDGKLYFLANDGTHGLEIWTTDGSLASTSLFIDINKTGGTLFLVSFVPFNGKLYFVANDGSGENLWETDGNAINTKSVKPAVVTSTRPLHNSANIVPSNGLLYFRANYDNTGIRFEPYIINPSLSSIQENDNIKSIKNYPNPFSLSTTLYSNTELHNAKIFVKNCFGQTVKEIDNINGKMVELVRGNLTEGHYFLQLMQDDKVISTSKIIIVD